MKSRSRLKQNYQSGFTLIELIAVIAIIALIASVLTVAINDARIKSRNGRRVSDVNAIAKAMELYFSNCNSFPQTPSGVPGFRLDTTKSLYLGTRTACGTNKGDLLAGQSNGGIGNASPPGTILIQQFAASPLPVDDGTLANGSKCSEGNTQLAGSTWNDYVYVPNGDPSKYWLYFCISKATGDFKAGRNILTERGVFQFNGTNYFP